MVRKSVLKSAYRTDRCAAQESLSENAQMPQLVVKLKDREIQRVSIYRAETTVGRDPTCDVVIDNMGVSRVHAVVALEGDTFFVRDAGSSNGVFVEGAPVAQAELPDGHSFQVGKFNVVLSPGGGIAKERLSRPNPLAEPAPRKKSAAVANPDHTTTLNFHDLERSLEDGRRPHEASPKPIEPMRRASDVNIVTPAAPGHMQPHRGGPMLGSAGRTTQLEARTRALRQIVLFLCVAVAGLVGLTFILLTIV